MILRSAQNDNWAVILYCVDNQISWQHIYAAYKLRSNNLGSRERIYRTAKNIVSVFSEWTFTHWENFYSMILNAVAVKNAQNSVYRLISRFMPSPELHKILILCNFLNKKIQLSLMLYNDKKACAPSARFRLPISCVWVLWPKSQIWTAPQLVAAQCATERGL